MPREREERALALAVAAVCLLALMAILGRVPHPGGVIGSADALTARSQTPTTHAHRPLGQVDLRITLWPHGPVSASRTWRITCPGTGCSAARAHAHDLITEPSGECRRQNSGPAEAIVVGRVGGHFVDDWFDKRDGCSALRWRHLQAVLRAPVRPVPTPGR